MKTLIEHILRKMKGPQFRFDSALSSWDLVEMLWKVGWSLIRGLIVKPFLGDSGGLLLISPKARLRNKSKIRVGRNFIAEENCEIQGLSRRGITFGDNVTVGSMSMIRPSGYYGNSVGEGLRMGNGSNVGAYSYVGCSGFIEIGDNVMMGPRVSFFAENHTFDRTDMPMKQQGVNNKGIRIEDDCWLGSGAIFLDGVTVGKGSIVAAGSVVSKSVEPYSIVGGVPAKLIKSRLESGFPTD